MPACGKSHHENPIRIHMVLRGMLPDMSHGPGHLAECLRILTLRCYGIAQDRDMDPGCQKLHRYGLCLPVGSEAIATAWTEHDRRTGAL